MRKWFVSLLALLALAVTAAVPATAAEPAPFADLPASHWAHAAVARLVAGGVIAAPGPQAAFRPDQPIRRSELMKMLLLARSIDPGSQCASLFADVPCWAWYAGAVETAYRMGIAEGVGAGKFTPDGYVTRQQLFTFVVRVLGRRWEAEGLGWTEVRNRLAPFADRDNVAEWGRPALALSIREKLTSGYADGTLRPTAPASRAEAAVVVDRIRLVAGTATTVKVDGRNVAFAQGPITAGTTMYATGEPGVGLITYTGMLVRPGMIAVDPTVIPLGKLLYVEGYGYGIAGDIGGAIKGNKVDLYTLSYGEASEFGVQSRRVWVLP